MSFLLALYLYIEPMYVKLKYREEKIFHMLITKHFISVCGISLCHKNIFRNINFN